MTTKFLTSDFQKTLEREKEIKAILKSERSDEMLKTKLEKLGVKLYAPTLPNINGR